MVNRVAEDEYGNPLHIPVRDCHEWYDSALRIGIFQWQVGFSCRSVLCQRKWCKLHRDNPARISASRLAGRINSEILKRNRALSTEEQQALVNENLAQEYIDHFHSRYPAVRGHCRHKQYQELAKKPQTFRALLIPFGPFRSLTVPENVNTMLTRNLATPTRDLRRDRAWPSVVKSTTYPGTRVISSPGEQSGLKSRILRDSYAKKTLV